MDKTASSNSLFLIAYMSLCIVFSLVFIVLVKLGGVPSGGIFALSIKGIFVFTMVLATIKVANLSDKGRVAVWNWGLVFLGNIFLFVGLFAIST